MRNIRLLWGAAGTLALFAACSTTPSGYTVEGLLPDSTFNGKTLYMTRYDDNKRIDSAVVEGNKVVFTGVADTAHYCRIDVSRPLYASFILENGEIAIDFEAHQAPSGTPLNDEYARLSAEQDSLSQTYMEAYEAYDKSAANWQEVWGEIYQNEWKPRFEQQIVEMYKGHTDDAIGHALIYDLYGMDADKALEIVNSFGPWLASTQRAQEKKAALETEKRTAPGQPYVDVKGTTPEGEPVALSDYVGKGNYVLVDMWASWCGPCKREIPNLANVYNLYKDKGLTVVGIFVWDKLENLAPTVEAEGITWPQIVDTEDRAATKAYGVQGIPCIMLIGPDGTILDRTGLRGENMQPMVEKYMFGK